MVLFLLSAHFAAAQEGARQYQLRFQNGIQFYRQMRMLEAAVEFRQAQEIAANRNDRIQALYWIILAELALADYGSALRDMDVLEKDAPNSAYAKEMVFHRARAYFNLGFLEDALTFFQHYIDNTPNNTEAADRIAAAYFWMGECLYYMAHFEEAEKFYAWVIAEYPDSPRVEASSYRIDIIKHKRIEAELLALLRWSHEESLRNSEEYQRRIRTYEHNLNLYQRRIAELTQSVEHREIEHGEYEEIRHNADNTADTSAAVQDSNADLIERARQLGMNIQRLINDHEHTVNSRRQLSGGSW